ncbi:MAG: family 78 glycoside hydrolase catalytic domain [Lachnospiraceae bacterium]|nr:family 78 glycoside hydrolase catalytic domain [Lachnospiraceae bacterium]
MVKVENLRINYQKEIMGIEGTPRFSWEIQSDRRNVLQQSYQIQIAGDAAFAQMVYDSGNVASECSVQVVLEDFSLEPLSGYYVRVRVTTGDEQSAWSESAHMVSGMLTEESWEASFVSAETPEDKDDSKGTYVRGGFRVEKEVREAYACCTALGVYNLYINGTKIGKDELTPGWTSYNKNLLYQIYDVKDALNNGANMAGAMLAAGWYKGLMGFVHKRNNYGCQTAFLFQMLIRYADGTSQLVMSDENWQGADAPIVFSEIYDGEIYDAAKEIKDWSLAGTNTYPWKPVETLPADKTILHPQGAGKVTQREIFAPRELLKTPKGEMVLDFGQNMSGRIHVKAKGKKGDVIQLNCFEVLDKDGNVYLDNLRKAKQNMTYVFAEDKEVEFYPRFTFMGFRYAVIRAFPGEPKAENFEAHALYSDMEPLGEFACSNADLNQLHHNILWGLKGNFVDVPTDCPQRDERCGWTGDAQIFSRTACYLMDTYTFYEKWLRDVVADTPEDGSIPHVVPDILTGKSEDNWLVKEGSTGAAAWADVAVINPWTLYLMYGDTDILKKQFENMKGWIDFMEAHATDYIWNYKVQFGDWVALDAEEGSYFGATPNDLTCTAYFAYSTELFVKICKILGKQELAQKYQELYDHIVETYQKRFFNEDGSMNVQTQTAHIVSLYFKLVPKAAVEKVVEGLLRLLKKENGHLVTGFVGTPYFCHALSQNGCLKEAYELLLKDDFPSWLYQVKMGATTVWEHWDGIKPDGTMWSPGMNSFNHYAYGAVGEWLYRVASGIEADEANPG